jgi:hypothetical protein
MAFPAIVSLCRFDRSGATVGRWDCRWNHLSEVFYSACKRATTHGRGFVVTYATSCVSLDGRPCIKFLLNPSLHVPNKHIYAKGSSQNKTQKQVVSLLTFSSLASFSLLNACPVRESCIDIGSPTSRGRRGRSTSVAVHLRQRLRQASECICDLAERFVRT